MLCPIRWRAGWGTEGGAHLPFIVLRYAPHIAQIFFQWIALAWRFLRADSLTQPQRLYIATYVATP